VIQWECENYMMGDKTATKSVAIIGAGAAGAVTTAAFAVENYFDRIQTFERRGTPGGTWIFDPDPGPDFALHPGSLPTDIDPPLRIPEGLPKVAPPNGQERYSKTPIYTSLTTNVPDIAMSFSDSHFAYGPFAPHHIPRQYLENYFSIHKTDSHLVLNTTVEDVSQIHTSSKGGPRWKLTLRKYDPLRHVDEWWTDEFDFVVFANGHYSVPYVPVVKGLDAYLEAFPGRVVHSKYYRSPLIYASKKILVIGNSASGTDITNDLVSAAHYPVYQSRRSPSRWDGDEPPPGIEWKPMVREYLPSGRIVFEDDSYLDDVDTVIYCTGYKASFPFWNAAANGRPLYDYEQNRLRKVYQHTFFHDFPSLGIVGVPRALTFRSFEYQAIALARVFAGRNSVALPSVEEQERWERERWKLVEKEKRRFHDIQWDSGETLEWLGALYDIAGLPTLKGEGRTPPVLGEDVIWAIEHLRKYPEPPRKAPREPRLVEQGETEWVVVHRGAVKDSLQFI